MCKESNNNIQTAGSVKLSRRLFCSKLSFNYFCTTTHNQG
nr:MAG TPA: hypothetical protein [Caudoviricetes sp.]